MNVIFSATSAIIHEVDRIQGLLGPPEDSISCFIDLRVGVDIRIELMIDNNNFKEATVNIFLMSRVEPA